MKKAAVVKAVTKKPARSATPKPASPPQPLLNVVPLDDVTRLITDGFKANLDEIRELCEAAKHPLVAANKPESVGPSLMGMPLLPVSTDDVKPILFHDADRVTLETLFGGEPISTPADIVRLSTRLSTVSLLGPTGEACSTTIPLDTLERLEARRPIDTTLKEMIERGFADYLEGLINGVF